MRNLNPLGLMLCCTLLLFGGIDLGAQSWVAAPDMSSSRLHHASVVLPDGRVVICGGSHNDYTALASCEAYDYELNSTYQIAGMNTPRWRHSMVVLPDGRVLVAGGSADGYSSISSCEVYDPLANTWTATGAMLQARNNFTLTLLPNGKVIAIGGIDAGSWTTLKTCEIYNPATGVWSPAAPIGGKERNNHQTVLLNSGKLLVTNGYSSFGRYNRECEIYDPATDSWTSTGAFTENGSGDHTCTLLDDGTVLLAGGWTGPQWRCEVFHEEIAGGQWIPTTPLKQRRAAHEAVKLANGRVLVIGGLEANTVNNDKSTFGIPSCEMYNPLTATWSDADPLPVPVAGHTVHLLPNEQVVVIGGARWQPDHSAGLVYNKIFISQFPTDANSAKISGRVVRDANGDCTIDPAEEGQLNRFVRITPGPVFTNTDEDGYYEAFVNPGTYTVEVLGPDYWSVVCPQSGEHSATLAHPDDESVGNNFFMAAAANVERLRVSLVSGRIRPGFRVYYTIRYFNVGTIPFNGTLKLHYDPRLHFLASEPAPDSHDAATLEWSLTDVPVGEVGEIYLAFRLNRDVALGTEICAEIVADPDGTNGGNLSTGSSEEFCDETTGSYDPNDISVFPAGTQPHGRIRNADSVLTYLVRFQNMGTDTAFTVRVVSRLSEHLDVASLQLGAASHDFRFKLSGKGTLEWTFDNILLPDNKTDEEGSHGFLKYTVKLKPKLPAGSAIENQAAIYFDYNEPVLTNVVKNTIGNSLTSVEPDAFDSDVQVYPNPAHDVLGISMANGSFAAELVSLHTINGATLIQRADVHAQSLSLDVSQLANGTYFLKIRKGEHTIVRKVTIQR